MAAEDSKGFKRKLAWNEEDLTGSRCFELGPDEGEEPDVVRAARVIETAQEAGVTWGLPLSACREVSGHAGCRVWNVSWARHVSVVADGARGSLRV